MGFEPPNGKTEARTVAHLIVSGAVAHLGERCFRKAEVESSNLFSSTDDLLMLLGSGPRAWCVGRSHNGLFSS